MTTEQLSNFIQAAQCLNFTDVARRSFLTQPAISRQISDLEEQLGVPLFVRAGHKLLLTDEGALFLEEAKRILGGLDEAALKVRRLHAGKTGRLSIGAVTSTGGGLMRCLRAFARRYPDIQVDVDLTTGTEQAASLRAGSYDIFFCDAYLRPKDEQYACVPAGEERFHLILPAGHPLERVPEDFSVLAGERFVLVDIAKAPILHRLVRELCARRGYDPEVVGHFNRREAILTCVGAGLGITIFPGDLSQVYNSAAIKCLPIPGEDCVLPSVILWRRTNPNPAVAHFRQIVEVQLPLQHP